jgi:hypothetical protein
LVQHTQNRGKLYQMTTKIYQRAIKYTKWPKNWQNDTKYIDIFHCKTLQNLPKLGFFGLKIYHLATLGSALPRFLRLYHSVFRSGPVNGNDHPQREHARLFCLRQFGFVRLG